MDLQEANLHSVKVDSDDPAYISSGFQSTLPSFVAAPGTTRPTRKPGGELIEDGTVEKGVLGEVGNWEDNGTHGIETLLLAMEV